MPTPNFSDSTTTLLTSLAQHFPHDHLYRRTCLRIGWVRRLKVIPIDDNIFGLAACDLGFRYMFRSAAASVRGESTGFSLNDRLPYTERQIDSG